MKSFLTLLTVLLLASPTALHAADSRPNIVFLFTDDQTIGAMGCYGNKDIITPHMDMLAADGVRVRNHSPYGLWGKQGTRASSEVISESF